MSESERIEPELNSSPMIGERSGSAAPGSGVSEFDDGEVSLLDVLVVIAENMRLLVFGPLLAGLIALGIAFLITPTFTARSSFLPPEQRQSASSLLMAQLGVFGSVAASAAGLKNPMDQYVALLKSRTVADRLIEQFDLMALYEADYRQDARRDLAKNTKISAGRDGLIVLEFTDASAQRAADIANAYVSELGAQLGRLALSEAQQRRLFFEKQFEESKRKLVDAERALAATGVSSGALKANPETAILTVARLQAQVTAQEVKLAAMRGYLTDSAPEMIQAQNELAALRAQLRAQERSQPETSQQNGYIDRFRDFKYQETLFELIARQYELARVDEAKEGAVIQVVDRATPPERKSHPRKGTIALLTALGALLILLMWVFARKAIESSAANPAGARKLSAIRAGLSRCLFWHRT